MIPVIYSYGGFISADPYLRVPLSASGSVLSSSAKCPSTSGYATNGCFQGLASDGSFGPGITTDYRPYPRTQRPALHLNEHANRKKPGSYFYVRKLVQRNKHYVAAYMQRMQTHGPFENMSNLLIIRHIFFIA